MYNYREPLGETKFSCVSNGVHEIPLTVVSFKNMYPF